MYHNVIWVDPMQFYSLIFDYNSSYYCLSLFYIISYFLSFFYLLFVISICLFLAYTLEYFADALKSCLKDGDGFIHLDGSQYYHIRPRHPFALKHDYWQAIPTPSTLDKSGQDISDIVISLAILVITIVGLTAALWKLKMFDWAFVRNHRVWKKRITAKAPSEGGYSR